MIKRLFIGALMLAIGLAVNLPKSFCQEASSPREEPEKVTVVSDTPSVTSVKGAQTKAEQAGKAAAQPSKKQKLANSLKEEDMLDLWLEKDENLWFVVALMAIIFGIPSIAIIVIIAVIFSFIMRRSRARNKIIAQAIEQNYTLPDSFYGKTPVYNVYNNWTPQNQTEVPSHKSDISTTTENGQSSPLADNQAPAPAPFPPQNFQKKGGSFAERFTASMSDRQFRSGATLAIVGACLMLFFFTAFDAVGVGFLAGGIPFFLGIGKMLGVMYAPEGPSEGKPLLRFFSRRFLRKISR